MPQIKIKVSPSGQIELLTEGFTGESCKSASEPFEKALGTKKSDKPTDDMFATQDVNQDVAQ